MNMKRHSLIMYVLLTACVHAYVKIDPPVAPSQEKPRSDNMFGYKNVTTIDSDVISRGRSLTQQNPGWTMLNTAYWQRGIVSIVGDYNLYANASDLGSNQKSTYLLTLGKIGAKVHIKKSPKQQGSLSIKRFIYSWPESQNWQWATCTASSLNLLSPSGKIKPQAGTEYVIGYKNMSFTYMQADHDSWGDYLHFSSNKYAIIPGYFADIEAGYWENHGRFYQGNLYYAFKPTLTGIIKAFDFNGYNGVKSKTGAAVVLQFDYQAILQP